jgi:hypothetical protein
MNLRQIQRVAVLLLLAGLLFASGCATMKSVTSAVVPDSDRPASKLSEAELREKLAAFYVEFINAMELATATAAARTDDLTLRQRLVGARLRAVRTCRQAVFQRQPMAAFVDTWSGFIQLDLFLGTAEARNAFGEALPVMQETVHKLNGDLEALGALFMKSNRLAEAKQKLEEFARAHPFSGQTAIVLPSSDDKVALPQLGWLFSIPLSPFRALEGVDQTAQAVQELTLVAQGFAQTANDMPRELAWQSELLLLQARREMSGLLDELDRKQTNTQATVRQLRGALSDASNVVARLDPTLTGVERTLKTLSEASGAVDATLKTYTQMVKDLYPPKTDAEKAKEAQEPPGRPFDILDYAKTAQGITEAASELRQVLVEFQKTVATNAVSLRLQEVESATQNALAKTETSTRQLVDHLARRALLVIAVFFVALLLYRIATLAVQKKWTTNRKTEAPSRTP